MPVLSHPESPQGAQLGAAAVVERMAAGSLFVSILSSLRAHAWVSCSGLIAATSFVYQYGRQHFSFTRQFSERREIFSRYLHKHLKSCFFYIIIAIKDNVYSAKNSTLLFHQNVAKEKAPQSTLGQPERGLGVEKGDLKEARSTVVRKTQLAISGSPDTPLQWADSRVFIEFFLQLVGICVQT